MARREAFGVYHFAVEIDGVQEAFFRSTFQVMGHIAKADGRVSEEEIRAARAMMNELRLGENEVRFAIELFREGKAADFPLEATLQQLYRACRNRPDLCRMFMTRFISTHLIDDCARAQVILRQLPEVFVEMFDYLALGLSNETEADAIARHSSEHADSKRSAIPEWIQKTGSTAQFPDAL